jgi:hypothetical protein
MKNVHNYLKITARITAWERIFSPSLATISRSISNALYNMLFRSSGLSYQRLYILNWTTCNDCSSVVASSTLRHDTQDSRFEPHAVLIIIIFCFIDCKHVTVEIWINSLNQSQVPCSKISDIPMPSFLNLVAPKRTHWLSAACLLAENSCLQRTESTDNACAARTPSAMWPSVGKKTQLS